MNLIAHTLLAATAGAATGIVAAVTMTAILAKTKPAQREPVEELHFTEEEAVALYEALREHFTTPAPDPEDKL